RRRHAAYFLTLADTAEPMLTGPDQSLWLARLDREHPNLRAALAWMRRLGETEPELRLAGALWRFWMVRGHFREGRDRLLAAVSAPDGPAYPASRAKVLLGAGMLSYYQDDTAAARSCF